MRSSSECSTCSQSREKCTEMSSAALCILRHQVIHFIKIFCKKQTDNQISPEELLSLIHTLLGHFQLRSSTQPEADTISCSSVPLFTTAFFNSNPFRASFYLVDSKSTNIMTNCIPYTLHPTDQFYPKQRFPFTFKQDFTPEQLNHSDLDNISTSLLQNHLRRLSAEPPLDTHLTSIPYAPLYPFTISCFTDPVSLLFSTLSQLVHELPAAFTSPVLQHLLSISHTESNSLKLRLILTLGEVFFFRSSTHAFIYCTPL